VSNVQGTVERVFERERQHQGAKKQRMLSLSNELRNALARGVYTAYPLFGMRGTVVQEAVEEPLAQKDAWARCPS
jgi:hypothetical protein